MHTHNAANHFLRIISVLPLQCHQHPQDLARSFPGLFDLIEEGTTDLKTSYIFTIHVEVRILGYLNPKVAGKD